ncbi:hypothetical protein N9W89_12750 [Hellea sp.]|nr:hypothetical protein [Hellea sp.]
MSSLNPAHDVRWHYCDVYLWEIDNSGSGWVATNCCTAFGGSRDMIRLDEDFEAWAEILCAYERKHDTGGEFADLSGFNWDSFNSKGLVLAKRLKRELGPDYHIQYSKCILDKEPHAQVWVSPEGDRVD